MRTIIAASTALLALAGAASADHDMTAEVHYTQSQLSHSAGVQEVRQDLLRAARDVCDIPGAYDSDARRAERACVEAAFADAASELTIRVAEANGDDRPIRVAARFD